MPTASPFLVSRMRLAMGSFVTARAAGPVEKDAEAAVAAALDVVARLEDLLHPTRPNSEIAAINATPVGTAVSICNSSLRVLKIASQIFEATQGMFDPCLPNAEGRFSAIELAPDHVVIHERVSLDLGGIAKGFAVDEAVAVLKEYGCSSGSVNVGGEVAAFGTPELIVLRRADGSLSSFRLENEALAVTDVQSPSQPSEHRGYYQRANQRDPVRDYAALAAPTAAVADALTKCALYCSADEFGPVLARFRARLV
jgi:thiamine biosynthesis lipoprotein